MCGGGDYFGVTGGYDPKVRGAVMGLPPVLWEVDVYRVILFLLYLAWELLL